LCQAAISQALADDAWNEGLSVNATEHAHDLVHARFARL
jgi:hypothetical protein